MDSLAESEISQISRLQRDAGLQRLSCHFTWPDFSDERLLFHQEFVYDVAMLAASRGFSWPNVTRAAVIAKDVFPQLDGHDLPKLSSTLTACLPNLATVHQRAFTQHIVDTCVGRRRLFQAVLGGAANTSVARIHLEVQLPPTPCPLEQAEFRLAGGVLALQGTELHEWEHQRRRAEISATLQQKEEELRRLRNGSRVTLGEVDLPEDEQLDTDAGLELVRAAVRATEAQVLASLHQEASLLGDMAQLKLQQAALATGRLHQPITDTSAKANTAGNKSGRGV